MRTRNRARNFGKDLTNQESENNSFINIIQRHRQKVKQSIRDKNSNIQESLKLIEAKSSQEKFIQERIHEILAYSYSFFDKYLGTSEYISSLYEANKQSSKQIQNGMQNKFMFLVCPQLTVTMRNILIEWLIEVHQKMSLRYETLFLSIYLIDNFCSRKSVYKSEYQLLAMACLFIAGKYEQIATPKLKKIMSLCDQLYESHQVLQMQSKVLLQLNFKISQPSLNWFLGTEIFAINMQYRKNREQEGKKFKNYEKVCFYLLQLCLFEIEILKSYSPQVISNSILHVVSMQSQFLNIRTNSSIIGLTAFDLKQLRQCSPKIARIYQDRGNRKYDVVNHKYSNCLIIQCQNQEYSLFQ